MKPEDVLRNRLPNTSCLAQFFELLKHFVSKGATEIDSLGEHWCRIFINQGLFSDLADLYTLEKEQLLEFDRMGDKLATRILANVETSKQKPPPHTAVRHGNNPRGQRDCRVAYPGLQQHRRDC